MTVESLGQFVEGVKQLREKWRVDDEVDSLWFRGQQRSYWLLIPKIYREFTSHKFIEENDIERDICEEFLIRAPILSETKPADNDPWEWYFLMQHYGAPTRLLDWTEGALLALYFAVKANPGYYDAAVWALDPHALNERVLGTEDVIPPSAPEVTSSEKKIVKAWSPATFGSRRKLPKLPIAVFPTHIARRISTQRSCFTVHGTEVRSFERLRKRPDFPLEKFVIPSYCVATVQRELATSGIDEITIFPDLDGLGRSFAPKYRSDDLPFPHVDATTRLKPSKMPNAGVGVFAITEIRKDSSLFAGENEEMVWIESKAVKGLPSQIRKMYQDFAIFKGTRLGCPKNFNVLTMAWYLNEPAPGAAPNVRCDPSTFDFFATRDIHIGEELTVRYDTYSDAPTI